MSELSCDKCAHFRPRKYNGYDYDNVLWCSHLHLEMETLSPCEEFKPILDVGLRTDTRNSTKGREVMLPSRENCMKQYAGKESYFEGMLAAKYRRDSSCKWDFC